MGEKVLRFSKEKHVGPMSLLRCGVHLGDWHCPGVKEQRQTGKHLVSVGLFKQEIDGRHILGEIYLIKLPLLRNL